MTGVRSDPPAAPGEWATLAACRPYPKGTFYANRESRNDSSSVAHVRKAQMICARCPVIEQCADYAINNHEVYGVWGGYSERDRKRIWRGETVTRKSFEIDHGTYRGYEQHRRLGVVCCDECREAMQRNRTEAWQRRLARRAAQRQADDKEPAA